MKAILSDIHGNLEALHAVLEDIARHPVEAICCLGDVVGYGPNPRECLDQVMGWPLVLLGNHDQATLFDPPDFNPVAARAIAWTRAQLEAPIPDEEAMDARWEFLAARPRRHRDGDLLFVHGSPRNPLNEYVFPQDAQNPFQMERLFALIEHYCFQGHTHLPGIFTQSLDFISPEDVDYAYRLDSRKIMCNVGSVGQPRDGDWRACYVLLDGETIRYRRVEYDVETTIKKIQATDVLDPFLGERLRQGR
jgi:predicted phosphodiesterase